jgi:hypothetical protein
MMRFRRAAGCICSFSEDFHAVRFRARLLFTLRHFSALHFRDAGFSLSSQLLRRHSQLSSPVSVASFIFAFHFFQLSQ